MKKVIVFVALLSLITSASAQVKPTTFEKVSDSLWLITEPKLGGELTTRQAIPITHDQLTVEINNRVRSAGTCFFVSGCLTIGASITGYLALNSKKDFPLAVPLILGGASVVCGFAGAINMMHDRVYLTPDGVILKLNSPKKSHRSTNVQQMK